MLSLSRKVGESIIINDNIVCTVLEISGKVVKIGFQYPNTATVLRQELYEKIQKENQMAIQNVTAVSHAIKTLPILKTNLNITHQTLNNVEDTENLEKKA